MIDYQASASEEEDDGDEDDEDDDINDFPPSAPLPEATSESEGATPPASMIQDPPPTIPPALLTRLLHHNFSKSDNTRISKEANGVIGKYMETFVREAIHRAALERREAREKEGGVSSGVAGDFLEVSERGKGTVAV